MKKLKLLLCLTLVSFFSSYANSSSSDCLLAIEEYREAKEEYEATLESTKIENEELRAKIKEIKSTEEEIRQILSSKSITSETREKGARYLDDVLYEIFLHEMRLVLMISNQEISVSILDGLKLRREWSCR